MAPTFDSYSFVFAFYSFVFKILDCKSTREDN